VHSFLLTVSSAGWLKLDGKWPIEFLPTSAGGAVIGTDFLVDEDAATLKTQFKDLNALKSFIV
jgi:hypothetical protein